MEKKSLISKNWGWLNSLKKKTNWKTRKTLKKTKKINIKSKIVIIDEEKSWIMDNSKKSYGIKTTIIIK
mgnify:CR=1 FL=1